MGFCFPLYLSYLLAMLQPVVPIWKQAPFLRLLPPLILGIIFQWYLPLSVSAIGCIAGFSILLFAVFQRMQGYARFLYRWIPGLAISVMLLMFGAFITQFSNVTYQQNWFGHRYQTGASIVAVLAEPLVAKNKSYKAKADVISVLQNDSLIPASGAVIIYFEKDSSLPDQLDFGSVLVFTKQPEGIENSGNPGAFDYKRYCLFQEITHQVYLRAGEFRLSGVQTVSIFSRWLQQSRKQLLDIIKRYIPGWQEAAVAEALLIGYRDDLERDLVQAYANTGVIHVIAISGMHLAMIYGLLLILLKPLRRNRKTKWISGLIILAVLWLFTLLSGAGASILRSAVMFSFITVGESMRRKVSVYHSLSASAFFLLCWHPFFLWDAGFQLSYAAVLSIIVFLRPITNWVYSRYRVVNQLWKLIAVTLAAQILTLPLSIFHFHQIPNLFLLSNIAIVPLSGVVLYGLILLCLAAPVPILAIFIGKILAQLLQFMNQFIVWVDELPFSVSDEIPLTLFQSVLLYAVIISVSQWLMKPDKQARIYVVVFLSGLLLFRVIGQSIRQNQTRVIVYNVPRYGAVDFISGARYYFIGDRRLTDSPFLSGFHLRPSRILHQVKSADTLNHLHVHPPFYYFKNRRILFLDSLPAWAPPPEPSRVDIIVLSNNVNIKISRLQQFFSCSQYVFDASNRSWKIRQWKNECDSLHLRRHSVGEDGAFILDL